MEQTTLSAREVSGLAVLGEADADGILALQDSDDLTVLHLLHGGRSGRHGAGGCDR